MLKKETVRKISLGLLAGAAIIFVVVVLIGLIAYDRVWWGTESYALPITKIAFIAQCVIFPLGIGSSVFYLVLANKKQTPIEGEEEGSAPSENERKATKKKKLTSVIAGAVATVMFVVLLIGGCTSTNGSSINKIYLSTVFYEVDEELGYSSNIFYYYVDIEGSSGSYYYTVDSNPDDSTNEYTQAAGFLYVEEIVAALHQKCGVPSHVWTEMTHTSALDGRQTYTHKNLTISWTYHPDEGLEIIYYTVD